MVARVLVTFGIIVGACNAVSAQHLRIFACAIANDSGKFMGASSMGSGLYQSDDTGRTWRHLGWENIKAYSMEMVELSDGRVLYLASGLGVMRSVDFGEHWKVLTDWRISEALDIAVDQKNAQVIYLATAHGPFRSRDGGATWQELTNGLPEPYTSRVQFEVNGRIILRGESTLYELTQDSVWMKTERKPVGMEDFPLAHPVGIMNAHASLNAGLFELVGTLGQGLFVVGLNGKGLNALPGRQIWSLKSCLVNR
jgi:hypothetical protein